MQNYLVFKQVASTIPKSLWQLWNICDCLQHHGCDCNFFLKTIFLYQILWVIFLSFTMILFFQIVRFSDFYHTGYFIMNHPYYICQIFWFKFLLAAARIDTNSRSWAFQAYCGWWPWVEESSFWMRRHIAGQLSWSSEPFIFHCSLPQIRLGWFVFHTLLPKPTYFLYGYFNFVIHLVWFYAWKVMLSDATKQKKYKEIRNYINLFLKPDFFSFLHFFLKPIYIRFNLS